MQATVMVKPPKWFWVAAVLALLWMLVGVLSWVMDLTMDEARLAAMDPAQRELYETRPQWVFIIYAIAIFSGLAGAIGLLMRKAWAVHAFTVSLVAVVIQFGYVLFGMRAVEKIGAAAALPLPLFIFIAGILMLWLAIHARKRGWIG